MFLMVDTHLRRQKPTSEAIKSYIQNTEDDANPLKAALEFAKTEILMLGNVWVQIGFWLFAVHFIRFFYVDFDTEMMK